jgi:2C-methyl-D-erythritol 2,4-cyclodiphosphate synthase
MRCNSAPRVSVDPKIAVGGSSDVVDVDVSPELDELSSPDGDALVHAVTSAITTATRHARCTHRA